MTFLKKYWWVFVLIIGAFLLYWFMFRKEAAQSKSKGFVCNNTQAQWTAKVASKIVAMKADSYWSQEAAAKVAAGTYTTLDSAYASMADWSLRVEDRECNPNYPLNAVDQFGA